MSLPFWGLNVVVVLLIIIIIIIFIHLHPVSDLTCGLKHSMAVRFSLVFDNGDMFD